MMQTLSFPRKPRRHVAVLLVLGALALPACVKPDDPGVKVNPLSAELVFGVKPTDAASDDANVLGIVESAPLPEEIVFEEAFEEDGDRRPPLRTPKKRAFEFGFEEDDEPQPEEEFVCYPYYIKPSPRGEPLALVGPSRPPLGVVRWNGFETVGAGNEAVTTNLTPNSRLLRNLVEIDPGTLDAASKAIQDSPAAGFEVPEFGSADFRFEVVQPLGSNFLVSTYQVGKPFVTPNAAQNAFRVSDAVYRPRPPDAGVTLLRTEVVNEDGTPVEGMAPFAPSSPLMLLPLPATATERFISVAVDTTTGKVIKHEGKINGIQRINACGEPVDGWSVTIGVTMSTPGETYDDAVGNPCVTKNATTQNASFPRCFQYDLLIAPQHGGLIISEAVTQGPAGGLKAPPSGEDTKVDPVGATGGPCQPNNTTPTTLPPTTLPSTSTTAPPTSTTVTAPPPPPPPVCPTGTAIPAQTIIPPDEGTTYVMKRELGTLDPDAFSGNLADLRSSK